MFDFSFGKLAIIFTLCLIVLGPEKLPKLAQTLGRFAGQARAMARHFRTQLEQEIAAGELAKQKQELEAAVKSSMEAVSSPISTTAQTFEAAKEEIKNDFLPYVDPSAANNSGHTDYGADTEETPNTSASAEPNANIQVAETGSVISEENKIAPPISDITHTSNKPA